MTSRQLTVNELFKQMSSSLDGFTIKDCVDNHPYAAPSSVLYQHPSSVLYQHLFALQPN